MAWQSRSRSEKPSLASNPHDPSSTAYLAYPVKHVVSSLYRRMTEPPDQPVNRLLDAPSTAKSPSSASHSPVGRLSPFQPPPLSPLELSHNLSDASADALLLTKSLAEEIRLLIPSRLQLSTKWKLAYSLENHGASLSTLYEHCERANGALAATQRGGYVLVVRDGSENATNGSIFGAYLTDAPKPSQHYYGTGECFLWRASILPSLRTLSAQISPVNGSADKSVTSEDLLELAGLPPPPSADTTNAQRVTTVRSERRSSSISSKPSSPTLQKHALSSSSPLAPTVPVLTVPEEGEQKRSPSPAPSGSSIPDRIRFKAFPYSGINDYMIYCQTSFLSIGGGDGHYGLWLDDQLEDGISERCPTFGNEPLSDEDKDGKGRFDVLGVEIWYVGGG